MVPLEIQPSFHYKIPENWSFEKLIKSSAQLNQHMYELIQEENMYHFFGLEY